MNAHIGRTCTGLAVALLALSTSAFGQPVNDDCTNPIGPLAVPSDTPGSSLDATDDGPACSTDGVGGILERSVWYTVIGTGNTLTASLCVIEGSNTDPAIVVLCNGCAAPICVASAEDGCGTGLGYRAEVSWCSLEGVEYLIGVGSNYSNTGDWTLSLSDDGVECFDAIACEGIVGACCYEEPVRELTCTNETQADCDLLQGTWYPEDDCQVFVCPEPIGEDCDTATFIPPLLPYSQNFDNDLATADGPFGSCDQLGNTGNMQNDAWWQYTADQDCLVQVTVTPTGYDAIVTVRDNCTDLNELACSDDGGSGSTENAFFNALTGVTYYIQVGDTGTVEGGGPTLLEVSCVSATGACCFADGSCQVVNPADCTTAAGNYQGDGTGCIPNDCPQPQPGDNCALPLSIAFGAGDSPLEDLARSTCGRVDDYEDTCMGSYDGGEDIIYELTITSDVCVNISVDADTIWAGVAVFDLCPDVDPNACIATATSSTNPDVISDLFLATGVYYIMVDTFAAPECADFDLTIAECPPPPDGACCGDDGSCTVGTEADCIASGGRYQGDGTDCQAAICIGACCLGDGTCIDPDTVDACTTEGGTYQGDGTDCIATVCPDPPPNDDCENSICVADGVSVIGSTVEASGTDITSCGFEDFTSIWYDYTPTVDEDITATTCQPGTVIDTTLAVFDNCIEPVEIVCNDDQSGAFDPACDSTATGFNRASTVTWAGVAGTTYYIRAAGYNAAEGSVELLVTGGAGNCGLTCVGDTDNDGDVDTDDFLNVLIGWGACPEPCPPSCGADVAMNDCIVDTDDFLVVLVAWGPCPPPGK